MGSGKSTVGRQLAELAGRQFVDTDVLLQNRFGRSISQVFNIYGEAAFREHETRLFRSSDTLRKILVSCSRKAASP